MEATSALHNGAPLAAPRWLPSPPPVTSPLESHSHTRQPTNVVTAAGGRVGLNACGVGPRGGVQCRVPGVSASRVSPAAEGPRQDHARTLALRELRVRQHLLEVSIRVWLVFRGEIACISYMDGFVATAQKTCDTLRSRQEQAWDCSPIDARSAAQVIDSSKHLPEPVNRHQRGCRECMGVRKARGFTQHRGIGCGAAKLRRSSYRSLTSDA